MTSTLEVIFHDRQTQQNLVAENVFIYKDEELPQSLLESSSVLIDIDENGNISDIQPTSNETEIFGANFSNEDDENQNKINKITLNIDGNFAKAVKEQHLQRKLQTPLAEINGVEMQNLNQLISELKQENDIIEAIMNEIKEKAMIQDTLLSSGQISSQQPNPPIKHPIELNTTPTLAQPQPFPQIPMENAANTAAQRHLTVPIEIQRNIKSPDAFNLNVFPVFYAPPDSTQNVDNEAHNKMVGDSPTKRRVIHSPSPYFSPYKTSPSRAEFFSTENENSPIKKVPSIETTTKTTQLEIDQNRRVFDPLDFSKFLSPQKQ